MARTGLYQSEVKKARDALIAKGKHPSVDAVRIALGNTGSKTTIHKYLKELEELDGGTGGQRASIGETLQDLVARLAAQLHQDANARIEAIEARSAANEHRNAESLATLRKDVEMLAGQLQRAEVAAQQEKAAHGETRVALQDEAIARHTAEQEAAGLRERLAENDRHLLSLEEKHKHAREALEHYRHSVKEQRDQEQRRHEQQMQQMQAEIRMLQQGQVVKQGDVTRLNLEGARLVADLSHAQQVLYEEQSRGRQLAQQLATHQEAAQQANVLANELAGKVVHAQVLREQLAASSAQGEASSSLVRELELELAAARATLSSQQELVTELRAHLVTQKWKAKGAEGANSKPEVQS